MLWEAGLTVTIQVRLCPDLADFVKARNHASEGLKSIGDLSLSDTFLTFAEVVKKLGIEKEQDGISHGLRFNNAVYNSSMHRAAMGVIFLLEGDVFLKSMVRLEMAWGRELLSNAYSKLNRLVSLSKAAATTERTAQQVASWLVEMLHLALVKNIIQSKQATDVWLFGDRKHSTTGYWQACLVILEACSYHDRACRWFQVHEVHDGLQPKSTRQCFQLIATPVAWQVFDFLAPLTSKLPEQECQKCVKVLESIRDPTTCLAEFLLTESEESGIVREDEEDAAAAAPVEAGKLNKVKAEFNKATGSLLELLVDLMRGEYIEDCKKIAAENMKLPQAVTEAASSMHTDEKSGQQSVKLLTSLYLVVQAFDTGSKSVSLASTLPSQSLIQTLNPTTSSEQDAAVREMTWKQVQAERRKFVTFSVVPKYTKDSLNAAFRNSGKVWAHKGSLNASHRLIIGSADMMTEESDQPWLSQSPPAHEAWKAVAEFCVALTGSTDFTLLFDGRMREIRRINVP